MTPTMPTQRLHGTWLVATATEGSTDLERDLRNVASDGTTTLFTQVTDGQGALALGSAPSTALDSLGGDRKHAEFALRSVDPRDADPALDGSPVLLAVRLFVPEAGRDEVRRWLDEEHSAFQLRVPGVRWYLGYEEIGSGHSFLNLWGLDDQSVIESPAWAEARDTPWRSNLLNHFERQDRAVYRPVSPTAASGEVAQ
jgi:hypothetical protein